jgi:glycosyltransferase involved in cell wall biosynthesis
MAERAGLSVVLITRNEAARIARCLQSVAWADEIVVIDQHSTDGTPDLCRAAGARVIARDMAAGFGEQKNFALAQARQPWVLSLDADETVSPALRAEIEAVMADPGPCVAFRMPRLTSYLGRAIRHCGWYPSPVVRLVRRGRARFNDALVHEELVVDGPIGDLRHDLLHDSYDSLSTHARKLLLYTRLDAEMLARRGVRVTGRNAVWHLALKPAIVFARKYVAQRGFLEGWRGLVLSALAAFAVFINGVRLWERGRPATASSAPLRVLLVANFADRVGGGEESLLGLVAALDRAQFAPHLLLSAEGELASAAAAAGVPYVVLPFPAVRPLSLPAALAALWRARRLLRAWRIDLVHAHGSRVALYTGLAARLAGLPFVWHVRVVDRDPPLDRLLATLATTIVTNSRATARRLDGIRGAARKVRVVPNGVDLERFAPGPPDADLRLALALPPAGVIGFAGRLEPGKGADVLLAAAHRLGERGMRVSVLLIGEGPLRERLQEQSKATGVTAVFAGRQPDIAPLLRLCEVVVMPSRQEGFGRVIIEAMACGVPVVASRVGGIPETCVDGVTALLVPPDDAHALADAIAATLTDRAATARRTAAATADVRARFTLAAHADAVERAYRDAVRAREPER